MSATTDTLLCPLSSLRSEADAGGKAWSLAQMTLMGLPVPPGVVLGCAGFDRFVAENQLGGLESGPGLELSDWPRFSQRAAELQRQIMACALPDSVAHCLEAWWPDADHTWIVRSSAVGEDSGAASFAGQLDSVLHVDSLADLKTAVLQCWASYWSERALSYRAGKGAPLHSMGVIIQAMIIPIRGGVLFTQAPDDPNAMRIEYVDGHPESLVNGSQTPHSMVLPRSGGDSADFSRLIAQARALEEVHGIPQDIEWVEDADQKLWLVQSRPITAPALPSRGVVWSNVNVNENYPDPISPLLYSIAREAYENYFRNIGHAFGFKAPLLDDLRHSLRNSVGIHGARLYYNLTNIHRCIGAAPFGAQLTAAFDGFVGVDDEGKTGGRTQTHAAATIQPWRDRLHTAISATRALSTLPARVARFEAQADDYARDAAPERLVDASQWTLLCLLRGFLDIRFRRWTDASLADVAATLSYATLKALLRRRLGESAAEALPPTLLLAIPDVVSAGAVVSLWNLSRMARSCPELCQRLRAARNDEDWQRLYSSLQAGAHPEFEQAFHAHLERWGFRVSGELMLRVACHQEEPATLLPIIAGFIDVEGPSPQAATEQQAARRDAALSDVGAQLGWRWAPLLRLVLRLTQRSICYRERVRLKQALLYRRLRGVLLAMGRDLVQNQRLESADDLFFLEWSEIDSWLSGNLMLPQTIPDLVRLRRCAHADAAARLVPDTVQLPFGAYLSAAPRDATINDSDVLDGVGVSGGCVQAPARVLPSLSDRTQFRRGEILVARQTDPGWAPLFFLASGLVMERGGMLSHGAIVAREFGIPAVIAVPQATLRLKTGERVEVDGDRGRVHREPGQS